MQIQTDKKLVIGVQGSGTIYHGKGMQTPWMKTHLITNYPHLSSNELGNETISIRCYDINANTNVRYPEQGLDTNTFSEIKLKSYGIEIRTHNTYSALYFSISSLDGVLMNNAMYFCWDISIAKANTLNGHSYVGHGINANPVIKINSYDLLVDTTENIEVKAVAINTVATGNITLTGNSFTYNGYQVLTTQDYNALLNRITALENELNNLT